MTAILTQRTYPYSRWLDGQRHRLVRGLDFRCSLESMRRLLYRRATELELLVEVHRAGEGCLEVQSFGAEVRLRVRGCLGTFGRPAELKQFLEQQTGHALLLVVDAQQHTFRGFTQWNSPAVAWPVSVYRV